MVVCCGGVLWCVVVVCCCGWCLCVCVVVVCVWCVVKLGTLSLLLSLLPLLFPFRFPFLFLSYLSFSFSLAPSLTLALALVLSFSSFFFLPFYSLCSSLPFTPTNTVQSTDQQTRRSTFEAFDCDCGARYVHSNCQRIARNVPTSLPPSSSLLLPPPSLPHPEKKRGNFVLQEYFRRGNYFVITVLY